MYPEHSCLVFCDTKRRCENVADMLCKVMFSVSKADNIVKHKQEDRESLVMMLSQEGSGFMCPILSRTIRFGVAYHHRLVVCALRIIHINLLLSNQNK